MAGFEPQISVVGSNRFTNCAGSPGLVVMGGDSCSECCGFAS